MSEIIEIDEFLFVKGGKDVKESKIWYLKLP
jgi:hypothetical protein